MVTWQQLDRAIGGVEEHRKAVFNKLVGLNDPEKLIKFFFNFCCWHHGLSAGATYLISKIVRTECFTDPTEFISALSDRSMVVAAFLLDSVEQEFSSSNFEDMRVSRRCLSEAFLKGLIEAHDLLHYEHKLKPRSNEILVESPEIKAIKDSLHRCFGYGKTDTDRHIFAGLGAHLGSKLLVDLEFKIFDDFFNQYHQDILTYLKNFQFKGGGFGQFPAYAWIEAHAIKSSPEDDPHLKIALDGTNYALSLIKKEDQEKAHDAIIAGFKAFVVNKRLFLERA